MPGCPVRPSSHIAAAAIVAAGLAVAAATSEAGDRAARDGAWIRLAQASPSERPTPPLRLMPPSGTQTPSDRTAAPREPDRRETASPGAAPPDADAVTATVLGAVDTASVGLIDSEEGGLGVALWQGSKRTLIEKLISRLPARTPSIAARELAIRLLSTRARAPQGASDGPDLLTSRVSRLVELGAVEAASRLANQISFEETGETLARSTVEALFLRNDNAGACQRVRDFARRSLDTYWQRGLAFCLLLSGDGTRADIIVDILAERGDDSAQFFADLIETLNGGEATVVKSLPGPAGLDLAMMRAANVRLPADVLSSDRPAVLRSVATSPNADLDLRLAAGERALIYGAIGADLLNELYAAVPWEEADLADPATIAAGGWGPRGRALLLRSAAAATSPALKALTLSRAFELARENGGYDIMAGASTPVLASIPPDTALTWFAPDAVSALLSAGQFEQAQAWLGLAGGDAEAGAQPREAPTRLWAIGLLAAPQAEAGVDETALAAWRRSAYADDVEAGRRAEVVALTLLEALGAKASPGRWAELLAESPPPRVPAPDIAWARALEEASTAGRVGETVLIALLGLSGSGADASGAAAMRTVVKSLRRVGLESEARALALETAVAHRL